MAIPMHFSLSYSSLHWLPIISGNDVAWVYWDCFQIHLVTQCFILIKLLCLFHLQTRASLIFLTPKFYHWFDLFFKSLEHGILCNPDWHPTLYVTKHNFEFLIHVSSQKCWDYYCAPKYSFSSILEIEPKAHEASTFPAELHCSSFKTSNLTIIYVYANRSFFKNKITHTIIISQMVSHFLVTPPQTSPSHINPQSLPLWWCSPTQTPSHVPIPVIFNNDLTQWNLSKEPIIEFYLMGQI